MPTSSTPPIERQATADHFLGLPAERFLHEYWQKHPLLVRGAFAGIDCPITPDDLAGLACEDGALARLIVHDAGTDAWRIEHGPFEEQRFSGLPAIDWTLLVQDVDKWDADVAAWLERFDFLPRWRIDDIMVSFAAPQGSVGAHVDQYDVFLIQGMGQRRWLIDTRPDSSRGFRTDVELRLLREFTPSHDWVLEPGDMLYLPPGIPHHGIALDAGLTLSVGMRAPSHGELLGDLADSLAQALPEEARFSDPDLTLQASDGRIDAAVLRRVRKALQSITQVGDTRLADWFGEFITCYRSAAQPAAPPHPPTAARIEKTLLAGGRLQPHPLTRCAWREQDGCAIVHINGERFRASRKLARQLARRQSLGADDYADLDADDRALVQHLARSGLLALPAD